MTYLDSLQTTLEAEHAAVYVYGVLGAQTSASGAPGLFAAITDAYTTHRARRDQLTARLTDLGADPVASKSAYQLPRDLSSAAVVTRRARELETSSAATYAYLVANSAPGDRQFAIDLLTDAAVRSLGFGATPEALPGSADLL